MHAHKMRPIATDVARSVVCVSVCVLVTQMCPAKTAELIEVPFDLGWAQKPLLDGGRGTPTRSGSFEGCVPTEKH